LLVDSLCALVTYLVVHCSQVVPAKPKAPAAAAAKKAVSSDSSESESESEDEVPLKLCSHSLKLLLHRILLMCLLNM
jgi:hypothetical protein